MSKGNVIITGAGKGIGRAISLKFSSEGYKVLAFGRNKENLESLKKEIIGSGGICETFSGDVADVDFVYNSVNEILKTSDKIDCLVNNAGVAVFKEFTDVTIDEFREQIDTNLIGIFNFCKAIVPDMIKNNIGTIINISSLAGKNGFVKGTTYGATKHAVMGFTKSLMLELRKYNIRVSAVCPGSVSTDMINNTEMKPAENKVPLQPMDIADSVFHIFQMPTGVLISELDIRPMKI